MNDAELVVQSVRSSTVPGLAVAGSRLQYRRRWRATGTYRHQVDAIDGASSTGLLIGFPVLGEAHGERTESLHRRLATLTGTAADGLAATVWTGVVKRADGSSAYATLAPDLYAEGFVPLHNVLRDSTLDGEPPRVRFELAYSLASAVDDLEQLGAVHGALNAGTMFVRPGDRSARITEVESATFAPDAGHLPLASGAATGYLAPEQYDGLGEHPETASLMSDRWALAVAVHEVLTGYHPYHFLPDLSPVAVAAYLGSQRWPQHHLDGTAAFAKHYATAADRLPDEVRNAFATSFQRGWADPAARLSAAEWRITLGRWIGEPTFDELSVDKTIVLYGDPAAGSVVVAWRTRFAHRVLIDGHLSGPSQGSLTVPRYRPGPIVAYAIGPCGVTAALTERIEVLRIPRLRPGEIRAPLALYPGGGRTGDHVVPRVAAPDRRPPPPASLPDRPALPGFPRISGDAPALPRVAETFQRLRTRAPRRHSVERHNP